LHALAEARQLVMFPMVRAVAARDQQERRDDGKRNRERDRTTRTRRRLGEDRLHERYDSSAVQLMLAPHGSTRGTLEGQVKNKSRRDTYTGASHTS
jgi:hypothetical protein